MYVFTIHYAFIFWKGQAFLKWGSVKQSIEIKSGLKLISF